LHTPSNCHIIKVVSVVPATDPEPRNVTVPVPALSEPLLVKIPIEAIDKVLEPRLNVAPLSIVIDETEGFVSIVISCAMVTGWFATGTAPDAHEAVSVQLPAAVVAQDEATV
jgi:hypothetical protein